MVYDHHIKLGIVNTSHLLRIELTIGIAKRAGKDGKHLPNSLIAKAKARAIVLNSILPMTISSGVSRPRREAAFAIL